MKKLLSILASLSFTASITSITVAACADDKLFQNIKILENDLNKILETKKYESWILNDLQFEIDKLYGSGAITVEEINDKNNKSKPQVMNQMFLFNGNAKEDNGFLYEGSITLTHTWTETIGFVKPITDINTQLQEILDSRKDLKWTKPELEQAIVDAKLDVVGGITVELQSAINYAWTGEEKNDKYIFTGHGTTTNEFIYEGSTTLNHEWIEKSDETLPISQIKPKLQEILDFKSSTEWSQSDLQSAIDNDPFINDKGGITVTEISNSNFTDKVGGTKEWKFVGIGSINNQHKYRGNTTLNHIWVESQPTIYIDSEGNEEETSKLDFADINAKEIKQFGFDKEGNSIQTFRGSKVSSYLPKQIKSLKLMFGYNQNEFIEGIENWDTSNITDMTQTFGAASFFNQPLNWDTSNVITMEGMFSLNDLFDQPLNWDTSKVVNMKEMFMRALNFNQDISKWDTSNVTNMSFMFRETEQFDQDISIWNVSKVTNYENFDLQANPYWDQTYKPKFNT